MMPQGYPMSKSLSSVACVARKILVVGSAIACTWFAPVSASAQASPSGANAGALTLSGGVDAPSVYVLRGLVQERDPKVTLTPYADLGITLARGTDGDGRLRVNLGLWNSLQTGSSGTGGFTEHLHYAENVYAGLSFGVTRSFTLDAAYTAYTSPNFVFETVNEVSLRVAHADRLRTYTIVAFDIGDNSFDGGTRKGSYFEAGVAPHFPLFGPTTLSVPVKVGASLSNYYEMNGKDHRFGFLSAGAIVTLPLSSATSRYGTWNVHGGAEVYTFGDTTKAINKGKANKVVATVGLAFTY